MTNLPTELLKKKELEEKKLLEDSEKKEKNLEIEKFVNTSLKSYAESIGLFDPKKNQSPEQQADNLSSFSAALYTLIPDITKKDTEYLTMAFSVNMLEKNIFLSMLNDININKTKLNEISELLKEKSTIREKISSSAGNSNAEIQKINFKIEKKINDLHSEMNKNTVKSVIDYWLKVLNKLKENGDYSTITPLHNALMNLANDPNLALNQKNSKFESIIEKLMNDLDTNHFEIDRVIRAPSNLNDYIRASREGYRFASMSDLSSEGGKLKSPIARTIYLSPKLSDQNKCEYLICDLQENINKGFIQLDINMLDKNESGKYIFNLNKITENKSFMSAIQNKIRQERAKAQMAAPENRAKAFKEAEEKAQDQNEADKIKNEINKKIPLLVEMLPKVSIPPIGYYIAFVTVESERLFSLKNDLKNLKGFENEINKIAQEKPDFFDDIIRHLNKNILMERDERKKFSRGLEQSGRLNEINDFINKYKDVDKKNFIKLMIAENAKFGSSFENVKEKISQQINEKIKSAEKSFKNAESRFEMIKDDREKFKNIIRTNFTQSGIVQPSIINLMDPLKIKIEAITKKYNQIKADNINKMQKQLPTKSEKPSASGLYVSSDIVYTKKGLQVNSLFSNRKLPSTEVNELSIRNDLDSKIARENLSVIKEIVSNKSFWKVISGVDSKGGIKFNTIPEGVAKLNDSLNKLLIENIDKDQLQEYTNKARNTIQARIERGLLKKYKRDEFTDEFYKIIVENNLEVQKEKLNHFKNAVKSVSETLDSKTKPSNRLLQNALQKYRAAIHGVKEDIPSGPGLKNK